MLFCQHCNAPLKQGAKFCPKCGNRVSPQQPEVAVSQTVATPYTQAKQLNTTTDLGVADQEQKQLVTEPRPSASVTSVYTPPTAHASEDGRTFQSPAPPTASVRPVVPPPIPTDPLVDETSEIASWKFNWGAFLVPGVWLLAHRIRPKILPLVLLGVPMAILSITTVTSILAARTAEQASASNVVNQGFGDTPYDLWNSATISIGLLLGLYILACLLSIRVARIASLDAWHNFHQQRLPAFRTAQRLWAIGGLLLFSLLVVLNAYVWARYHFWEEKDWQRITSPPLSSSSVTPTPTQARLIGLNGVSINHKVAGGK